MSVQSSFTVILILLSIVIVSTVWFMPSFKIPVPLPSNYKLDFSCSRVTSICGLVKSSHGKHNQIQKIEMENIELNGTGK